MPTFLTPWTYTYIRKLVDEATYIAQRRDLRPTQADEAAMNYRLHQRFNIPFIGDYVPAGWERVDDVIAPVIVDLTGSIKTNPPAITKTEFHKRLTQDGTIGYAVIERGQTHALVAAYRKTLIPLDQVRKETNGNEETKD